MSKAADAFRTISEVADELEVPKHVLRFWENRFPQIKPMKRGGGRRYYRPADLDLLRGIRHLLHNEGFTIKGVQKILREQGVETVKLAWQSQRPSAVVAAVVAPSPTPTPTPSPSSSPSPTSGPAPTSGAVPGSRVEVRDKRRGKAVKVASPLDMKAAIAKIVAELTACRKILLGETAEAAAEPAASAKAKTKARARR